MSSVSEGACVCEKTNRAKRESERWVMGMLMLCVKAAILDKFHFTSTHSMINADYELVRKSKNIPFQLNTVKEHDNHAVI